MSERDLKRAAQAVRDLAKEQDGNVNARDAHDAWRWVLVSRGWKPGEQLNAASKTHPAMIAFDALPESDRQHALVLLEESDDAEQNDDLESAFNEPHKG